MSLGGGIEGRKRARDKEKNEGREEDGRENRKWRRGRDGGRNAHFTKEVWLDNAILSIPVLLQQ